MSKLAVIFILIALFISCDLHQVNTPSQIIKGNSLPEISLIEYQNYGRISIQAKNISSKMVQNISYKVDDETYIYSMILMPERSFQVWNIPELNTIVYIEILDIEEYTPWIEHEKD